MGDSEPNAVEQVGQTVGKAVQDIGGYIRTQREGAQVSMRQLAKLAGISNPYLSQVERGLRKPSAEILGQIAKGLRISAEVLYVQAGILEERPADAIVAAVSADPALNERQKQALLEIYHSFRRENGPGVTVVESGPVVESPPVVETAPVVETHRISENGAAPKA